MIKSILRLTLMMACSIVFLAPQKAKASHAAGAELLYEWVSGSTYKIVFRFYRDCSGISAPATVQVCYLNDCNNQAGSINLTNTGPVNGTNLPLPCPGQPPISTSCAPVPGQQVLPGYQEYIYEGNVTLGSQCDKWTFYAWISARNPQDNISAGVMYIEATLDNMTAQGNSSPVFTVLPVPFLCVNVPYTYNNGANDVNNDSLGYEFIMPRNYNGGCQAAPPIPFNNETYLGATPAYNLMTNPIQTNNTFTFNNLTGMLSFTPSIIQTGTVCVRVSDYRNGKKIGSVIRDIQIQVINCTVPQPTVAQVLNSLVGCVYDTTLDRIEACAGQPFSFCFDVEIADSNISMNVTDNSSAIAPTSTVTYTNNLSDSVRGCFSWSPGMADTGLRILVINVQACNTNSLVPPITQSFTIPIYVWPETVASNDTLICNGDSVRLNVAGGADFEWTVISGDPNSLSCINCTQPWASPNQTTVYVAESKRNTHCPSNKDTVTITVSNPPDFTLGPDIITCVNNPVQLDVLNFTPQAGVNYTYSWIPTTYLSSGTIPNPISDPKGDISYTLTITPSNLIGCARRDTINITTLLGFEILNPDTAICDGQSVQIRATGDSRYTYEWNPVVGNPNNIINPLITPDTSTYYTVTASHPNCRDSVQDIYIDVQPVPQVNIFDDVTLCYGDTIHIIPEIIPDTYPLYSYDWTPGGAVNSNISRDVVVTAIQDVKPLTLTVTTPAGCEGSDTKDITVIQADFLTATGNTSICPGDSAQLSALGNIFDIDWTPNYKIDDTASANPIVKPAVTTVYTVSARDENYCIDTAQIRVEVKPAALVSLPDSILLYPGETYRMDPKGNALYFTWFPQNYLSNANIADPLATPPVNTRYFVTGRTEFGCEATDSIDIILSDDSFIDIPNAFSPGSQPNPVFKPVHLGAAKLTVFKVYNRWGQLVFETNDITQGWDGTYKGAPQPMGVYIYLLEAETFKGKKINKQGNVTLIR